MERNFFHSVLWVGLKRDGWNLSSGCVETWSEFVPTCGGPRVRDKKDKCRPGGILLLWLYPPIQIHKIHQKGHEAQLLLFLSEARGHTGRSSRRLQKGREKKKSWWLNEVIQRKANHHQQQKRRCNSSAVIQPFVPGLYNYIYCHRFVALSNVFPIVTTQRIKGALAIPHLVRFPKPLATGVHGSWETWLYLTPPTDPIQLSWSTTVLHPSVDGIF